MSLISQTRRSKVLPIRQPFLNWLGEHQNVKTRKDLNNTTFIDYLKTNHSVEWTATGTDDRIVVKQIKNIFDRQMRIENRELSMAASDADVVANADDTEDEGIQMLPLSNDAPVATPQTEIEPSPTALETEEEEKREANLALLKSLKSKTKALDRKIQELSTIRFEEIYEQPHNKYVSVKMFIHVLIILAMILLNLR
jgi:hypothetical protein